MVNTCMKTAGVVGSSIVAIASLAISIAEYLEVADDNASSPSSPSDTTSSSDPSSSVPSLSPSSSLSSSSAATASPPTRSPSIFETWSPTSSQTPSPPSPSPSSPSFSSSSPFLSSSSRSSRGSQMDSADVYDFSEDDFNAMAFGFLLSSVFFLGVSCLFWRSKKKDKGPKIEEEHCEDNEA